MPNRPGPVPSGWPTRYGPEPVALLEIGHVLLGIWQVGIGGAGACHQRQPDEVVAREPAWIVERQIGHHRHPVILDLAVAQQPGRVGMVADQRLHDEVPVRRDARCAVLGNMRDEGASLLRVGARQHAAVGRQPLDAGHAVERRAVLVPARRKGAAKAVEQLLRLRQAQLVGKDFEVQQHHVHVEKEIQVAMRHRERDGRVAGLRHQPHGGDVAPAEGAHRRLAFVVRTAARLLARSALSIQKALHIGQKADEFVVVAFLKALDVVAGVFLDLFAPGRCIAEFAQHLPGRLVRALCIRAGHQAQGPEQRLAKVLDLHGRPGGAGVACRCV